ncbi:uncharacterized protein LOC133204881 [Saccostrea echinata]|uniref:uncharacterized protein LOC133204881 n=1 Tax=Saccostrea echinata TaxID=191078 RepID=UPI002A83451B|nr:uncharacterized protein LOC133204881 [Saccostrea echinata]
MCGVHNIRATQTRSIRTCIAILLMKLKSGLDNQMLATLFNMTKFQIRRAVHSARRALMKDFVPRNLGFAHITRNDIIDSHTRPLAQQMFSTVGSTPAILVLDGTYIYIQKSGNYTFSRRSYSMHKHRPLLKPMMIVSTTGYIVSVFGPYLADPRNNDALILNHSVKSNTEEMKSWIREDDVFVVDRGFRDSEDMLTDLGIKVEMPAFLQKGKRQLTTEEANCSRLVTKVRWVVESVNGRIKTWKYLGKTLPNTQIPYIGDYLRIVCSICNKYRPPINTGTFEDDLAIATKMTMLAKQSNELQSFVQENGLDKRSMKWQKLDAEETSTCITFPKLTEDEIRELTIGVYQLKTAKSYSSEHFTDDGSFEVLVSNEIPNIISARIQSRHVSSKKYSLWVKYDTSILSWYCTCKNGARVVGMCGHIACVIWFLSYARHQKEEVREFGVRDWTELVEDAARTVDFSDSEDEVLVENQEE